MIRAKRDKPLALRKAQVDWRNGSLWINDCELVKWDVNTIPPIQQNPA